MKNKINSIAVLGSTGSVGTQGLEVAGHLGLRVDLLSAHTNTVKMEEQARAFLPRFCHMDDEKAANDLRVRLSDTDIRVFSGENGMREAIEATDAGCALNAVSGWAGLAPALACAKRGIRIAMSNKEAIVTAGGFLQKEIASSHAEMIPVDSEHSAIFQCLQGRSENEISRILLTASGGPFRHKTREELERCTVRDALAHPTWKMGAKITVDSASLMNKGFEVIEAVRLFSVTPDRVHVVVHPESIIHSAVEYNDNAVIAQLGAPDMRTCIQYAFTYPERLPSLSRQLDFASLAKLTFEEADAETFSLLPLAYYAIEEDGILPAVLNAADEVAVDAFLHDRIGFTDIFDVVNDVVRNFANIKEPSLDDIRQADAEARIRTKEKIYG